MDYTMTEATQEDGSRDDKAPKDTANAQETPPQTTSSTSLDRVGKHVKPLLEVINELRRQGVEDLIPPLPKIVVVGDQSTGKSSLIEAISEIQVPRDLGTCTRCPLEINLTENPSEGATWQGELSLHIKYKYDPPEGQGDESALQLAENQPFGHFMQTAPEDRHFMTLKSKDDVQDAISRAQLAVLSPNEDFRSFRQPHAVSMLPQFAEPFSPNVIRLDISGPGLPNLSLTDLPGVIQEAESDAQGHVVGLVENLVKSYIGDDNSLVLLARPMTEDANNSTAARYVKEMRADHRCMGVLTKPDLIQGPRSFHRWIELLEGKNFKKGHGYYVTRQPSQGLVDQPVPHTLARAQEEAFFQNEAPWNTEFARFSDRFGTIKLQNALSEKLTLQIIDCLPHIKAQVFRKAAEIDMQLKQLPEPEVGNPQIKLMRQLDIFKEKLQRHFDGDRGHSAFNKAWHSLALEFCKNIAESEPKVFLGEDMEPPKKRSSRPSYTVTNTPTTPTSKRSKNCELSEIIISDDDDEEVPRKTEFTLIPRKRLARGLPGLSSKKLKSTESSVLELSKIPGKSFRLQHIRDELLNGHTTGIPNLVDPRILSRLNRESIQHWDIAQQSFLHVTEIMLRNLNAQCLEEVFGQWKQTLLFSESKRIVNDHVEQIVREERERASRRYELEYLHPTTLNEEAFESLEAEVLKDLKEKRLKARQEWVETEALRRQPAPTKQARGPKDVHPQLGADPFAQQVEVMAQLRAYYRVAMYRFVDQLRLSVLGHLFVKCRDELCRELERKLGLTRPDAKEVCAQLMAEEPERERKRARLMMEKDRLSKAQIKLDSLV